MTSKARVRHGLVMQRENSITSDPEIPMVRVKRKLGVEGQWKLRRGRGPGRGRGRGCGRGRWLKLRQALGAGGGSSSSALGTICRVFGKCPDGSLWVGLPMEIALGDRESCQMAMSRGKCQWLKPSPLARPTGTPAHNAPDDPGGSLGPSAPRAPAPLPGLWAPMPLPGILRTCSAAC
jgi:hypothetical protein